MTISAQLRAAVIERDGGRCRADRLGLSGDFCKDMRDARGDSTRHSRINVHHIWPESQGGEDTLENLITLCELHHQEEHQQFREHFIVRMALRFAS